MAGRQYLNQLSAGVRTDAGETLSALLRSEADDGERLGAEGGQEAVVPEQPDDFEVALRTWSAQEEIIGEAYSIAAILELDPALAEEITTACRGGNADQGR